MSSVGGSQYGPKYSLSPLLPVFSSKIIIKNGLTKLFTSLAEYMVFFAEIYADNVKNKADSFRSVG
jgi:hypothetical protein